MKRKKKDRAGHEKSGKQRKYDAFEITVSPEAIRRFREAPYQLEYHRKYKEMVLAGGRRKTTGQRYKD